MTLLNKPKVTVNYLSLKYGMQKGMKALLTLNKIFIPNSIRQSINYDTEGDEGMMGAWRSIMMQIQWNRMC